MIEPDGECEEAAHLALYDLVWTLGFLNYDEYVRADGRTLRRLMREWIAREEQKA